MLRIFGLWLYLLCFRALVPWGSNRRYALGTIRRGRLGRALQQ
jgi:hypothetical protein